MQIIYILRFKKKLWLLVEFFADGSKVLRKGLDPEQKTINPLFPILSKIVIRVPAEKQHPGRRSTTDPPKQNETVRRPGAPH